MSDTVGLKVAVEGESEFRNSIRSINGELKMLSSDLKLVESNFKGQANSMAALHAKGLALGNMYAVQKNKVSELKTVLDAAKTAQNAYAAQIEQSRAKLSATEAALEKLKNSTGDTAAEEKKLSAELSKQKTDLANAEAGYTKTGNKVNDYQKQLNDAKIGENKLNDELKKNSLYMEEAKRSTDKCATSIDRFGKETQQAAEKSGLLQKIFAGGFLANIASRAVSALTGKLKEFATEGLRLASDLDEVQNVVDTTFGINGAAKVQAWADIAVKAFGISELNAKKFNGTLGAMLKSSGITGNQLVEMSTTLSGVAADFASFYNLGIEESFGKIRQAVGGETEGLKQLGINLAQTNLMQTTYAKSLNKTWNEMTMSEQAMTRYYAILELGADALGDFSKTSDSYANQLKIMQLETENLKTAMGQRFLPVAREVVGWASDLAGASLSAKSSISDLMNAFSESRNIQSLIDKYYDVSTSAAELAQAKQDLIASSNGVITAADLENGTFDRQIEVLKGANDAQSEYVKNRLIATIAANSGNEATNKSTKATEEQERARKKLANANAYLAENEDRLANGNIAQQLLLRNAKYLAARYSRSLEEAATETANVGVEATAATQAIKTLSEGGMSAAAIAEACGLSLETVNNALNQTKNSAEDNIPAVEAFEASLSALGEEYDTAKVAALDALNSTVGLWTAMDNTAITTATDIQTALDSQITWLNNYGENLDALAERKIPGVDTSELVQSLNDGSAESAAILAGLASATDAEVANVVASMGMVTAQKGKLSGEMGEVETGFGAALDSMKGKLSDTVGEMDMSDAAGKAAKSTMQAYVKSIKDMEGSATSAAARIARMVANVLNSTAGIIPQRHAKGTDYGENMYIAGEEGPELIVGRAGSKVWTADQTAAILAKSRNMEAKIMQTRPIPTDSGSRQTVNHTGTIRVQGVSSSGETLAVADIVMEQLRREARM